MRELTKDDSKILKGIAILFMIGLHLFNRSDTTGYYTPYIMIGNTPFIYYISFLFDACVPIYCFCAGYAAYINKDKNNKKGILKLLTNYWIILMMTCIVGLIYKSDTIPGNLFDFISSFLLYDIKYVGAWWFVQTYVLLTLTSKFIIRVIDKIKPTYTIIIAFLIYFIGYYFRMMNPIKTDYYIINIIINALVLYGTSFLPYIFGILFNKYKITTKIRTLPFKNKNLIAIFIILLCIIGHIIVKSMIVAPFVAIVFIIAIILIEWNKYIKKVFIFFGNHSTNIWLVHMQFYMIFCKDIVFITDTTIGCLVILVVLSLISSFIINIILKNKTLLTK